MTAAILRDYINDIENLRKHLSKIQGVQVRSKSDLNSVRSIVDKYFAEIRPLIIPAEQENAMTQEVDPRMQELLKLTHSHSSLAKYKTIFLAIKKNLIVIDSRRATSSQPSTTAAMTENSDHLICETLAKLVPSAEQSYRQALTDLSGPDRLSWRGPAADLREALRETLDYLAPDEDVVAQAGFKLEKDTDGPTMKQKVRFILKKRRKATTANDSAEIAAEAVEELLGKFVRSVYTRSNVSTHTLREKKEVLTVLKLVRVALGELLEV